MLVHDVSETDLRLIVVKHRDRFLSFRGCWSFGLFWDLLFLSSSFGLVLILILITFSFLSSLWFVWLFHGKRLNLLNKLAQLFLLLKNRVNFELSNYFRAFLLAFLLLLLLGLKLIITIRIFRNLFLLWLFLIRLLLPSLLLRNFFLLNYDRSSFNNWFHFYFRNIILNFLFLLKQCRFLLSLLLFPLSILILLVRNSLILLFWNDLIFSHILFFALCWFQLLNLERTTLINQVINDLFTQDLHLRIYCVFSCRGSILHHLF